MCRTIGSVPRRRKEPEEGWGWAHARTVADQSVTAEGSTEWRQNKGNRGMAAPPTLAASDLNVGGGAIRRPPPECTSHRLSKRHSRVAPSVDIGTIWPQNELTRGCDTFLDGV